MMCIKYELFVKNVSTHYIRNSLCTGYKILIVFTT